MTEAQEKLYLRGQRQVWVELLRQCLRNLGPATAEWKEHAWRVEREEAIHMLRRVCAEHGDNNWEEELHLEDIIDKHLWRHLDRRREPV